jgi:hypothetical protein
VTDQLPPLIEMTAAAGASFVPVVWVEVRCCNCAHRGDVVDHVVPGVFDSAATAVLKLPVAGWTRVRGAEPLVDGGEIPADQQRWRCPGCSRRYACAAEGHRSIIVPARFFPLGMQSSYERCERCGLVLTPPVVRQVSAVHRLLIRVRSLHRVNLDTALQCMATSQRLCSSGHRFAHTVTGVRCRPSWWQILPALPRRRLTRAAAPPLAGGAGGDRRWPAGRPKQ